MKKRLLLIYSIIPLFLGYFVAANLTKNSQHTSSEATSFVQRNIIANDKLMLSINGSIFSVSQKNETKLISSQNEIDPVFINGSIITVLRNTNYSSIQKFESNGVYQNTLLSGDADSIDSMDWFTDPSVNRTNSRIAYVSDKDKSQTGIPDNALYVLNPSTGKSTQIENPYPYSGGIANPTWNPDKNNSNDILYDYYEYDPNTLQPYSVLHLYSNQTGLVTTLTTEKQNAFQASFSPDGKQIVFLGRNDDSTLVNLYLANYSNGQLQNARIISKGDFAYPTFSSNPSFIYMLESTGNQSYDLYSSQIKGNSLINLNQITQNAMLDGNSFFDVSF